MRRILLHIYDDECFEARLQVALDISRRFSGHLTCIQAVPYDYGVPNDFYGTMAAQMIVDYERIAKKAKEQIEARLAKEDVPWNWIKGRGSAALAIAHYAPLHDLVVVGALNPDGKATSPSRLVSELLERVRAPILVVPKSLRSFDLDGPAAVAWNNSAESAHALRAAMPVLKLASSVHVLTIREKKEAGRFDLPSTKASEYLADDGIKSELTELPEDESASIAEILLEAAQARQAGYIVMGAYGHSRFRERVLGGVTHDMLKDPAIPLLLSH
ncbi:universal stress protein [Pontixanthobacter gangjinensis]|uniref:Universal stress protein n=1 Tax=Pontixanthobacter gangjinensis TaxID=1028742 RepID=A0A6I4SNG2_9SPHN|nr:universal stress protein [Pontixanthobacter gangjinensis]MXO57254.1 universal stress protein [Pontixanthobacter gangjinensis]